MGRGFCIVVYAPFAKIKTVTNLGAKKETILEAKIRNGI